MPGRPPRRRAPSPTPNRRRSSDFYRSRAWRRFRLRFLADHPLCVDCLAEGIDELATQVDHLETVADRSDLALDPSNCAARCATHHSRRTVREHGGFGRPRGG